MLGDNTEEVRNLQQLVNICPQQLEPQPFMLHFPQQLSHHLFKGIQNRKLKFLR